MNFHGGNIYDYDNEIIDFSSNINPLGVSEKLKYEISKRIDEVSKYPDIKYSKLKSNISKYLNVDKSNITVGNGAVDIIYRAVSCLPQKKAFIMAPAFSEYRKACEISNKEYFEIPSFDFDKNYFDIDFFKSKIEDNSIIIICNPNNPTGVGIKNTDIESIVEISEKKGNFIIIDEAFMEFTCDEAKFSFISNIKKYNNVLFLRAVTKFFGLPGIRLGYGISSNYKLNEKMEYFSKPWDINTFAVIASDVIFNDIDYIEKSKKWIIDEREFIYNSLSNENNIHIYKSDSNFFLIKTNKNSKYIRDELLKHNILIRIPEGFTGLFDNFIRIAVKDRESNIKIINALRSESLWIEKEEL